MACLNASVMMHLVDPLSHVDMLTWRNRLSRLTSDMLIAARKQDEPYHVVMALDWVRMNARISQATAAEEQYAAECEQLYCNELPQPTTAKKLDATCVSCSKDCLCWRVNARDFAAVEYSTVQCMCFHNAVHFYFGAGVLLCCAGMVLTTGYSASSAPAHDYCYKEICLVPLSYLTMLARQHIFRPML